MLIDYSFKHVEVDELSNTSSNTVIKIMKHNFARHGIPVTLISDGGPQFTSKEFLNFAIKLVMAERQIQTAKKNG